MFPNWASNKSMEYQILRNISAVIRKTSNIRTIQRNIPIILERWKVRWWFWINNAEQSDWTVYVGVAFYLFSLYIPSFIISASVRNRTKRELIEEEKKHWIRMISFKSDASFGNEEMRNQYIYIYSVSVYVYAYTSTCSTWIRTHTGTLRATEVRPR